MSFRNFYVSHGKDGFVLKLVEQATFREKLVSLSDKVCVLTRHRWCYVVHNPFVNWAWRAEKVLLEIPLTREQADSLAWSDDDWAFLDDLDDDD